MNTCPHCRATTGQVKNGRNASTTQRYRCNVCQRSYTPAPKPSGIADEIRREALQLRRAGLSLRTIGRLIFVNHQSVKNWVQSYSELPYVGEGNFLTPEHNHRSDARAELNRVG